MTEIETKRKELKSIRCGDCNGWLDFTGEMCCDKPVWKHRSKNKAIICQRARFKLRANRFWENISKAQEATA